MTRKEYADGLRAIAAFFEQHEEIALPHDAKEFNYYSANTKEDIALIVRALGSCDKQYTDYGLHLTRQFGAIKFRAVTDRAQVCKRVVVGKKFVPAEVRAAQPERLIPEHEEDVVEWECEPLLAGATPDPQTELGGIAF